MRARASIVKNPTQAFRIAIAAGLAGALTTSEAPAHFNLKSPPSWSMQNTLGDPQKSAPCGQADPGNTAQPTNVVTPFSPGQTISITLTETIFHPGHYRVALAKTRAELPADPPVTAGDTPCGSTVIQQNPTFPILKDGALVHTSALSGTQTIEVTLPTDITCEKCTLQVIEFMSDHALNNPGGCFYHHCADISIGMSGGGAGGGGAGGAGGKSSGGSANGGVGGGGKSSGGASSGGAGGKSSGGSANGGAGGTSSGGTSSGGASSGGAIADGGTIGSGGASGASSGGASSGGASSGGLSAGGATSGGAASGATSGGTSAGGANAGQGPFGGAAAEEGCGCSVPGGHDRSGAGVALATALAAWFAARRRRRVPR